MLVNSGQEERRVGQFGQISNEINVGFYIKLMYKYALFKSVLHLI